MGCPARSPVTATDERSGAASVPTDGLAIEIADIRVVPPNIDAGHLLRILVGVRAAS